MVGEVLWYALGWRLTHGPDFPEHVLVGDGLDSVL